MGVFGLFKKISHYAANYSVLQYIHYNFFSKKVVRKGKGKLIPYKHSVLQLAKGAKIVIYDRDVIIGINRLRRSREETQVRLGENATWDCIGGAELMFGSMIDIKKDALLTTGHFMANHGSVIVVDRKITVGEGCLFGRNVLIYDSDFHRITDSNGATKNPPREVVIGDRVWLTNNISVLKGVSIANGVIVSPYAVIRRDIAVENSIVGGLNSNAVIQNNIAWSPQGF